ncbi:IQ motif and ankyrin repeat domain-containing protein 1-like [Lineus longissimus]|uniref:IQ motif and ankyrin repeat domain-containing protein 1-like n=1 Tax=Lineus longissimus TaxID=88925 RepID=UPI002B4C95C5
MPPKPAPAKGATAKKAAPAKVPAAKPVAKKAAPAKAAPAKAPAAAPKQEKPKESLVMMGVEIGLKALANTLDSDELKSSGRWPLIIDQSGNAVTFLKYRDTNVLFAAAPALDMQGPPIRRAVMGSIRFGKPLVINMEESDDFDKLTQDFDKVLVVKDLMAKIMDRSILKDENYKQLVSSEDGDEYTKCQEREWRVDDFSFVLATTKVEVSKELCGQFYTIRIV